MKGAAENVLFFGEVMGWVKKKVTFKNAKICSEQQSS